MKKNKWIILSTLGAIGCFYGLFYIVTHLWPQPDKLFALPQLLFLTAAFLGLFTATVPIAAFFNHRFAQADWWERDSRRLVRQGVWVALLGLVLIYLQMTRALTLTIALVLTGVFALIETFFLTRI